MGSEEFDFVIVGGGTAGLVVAARLSENTDVRVLVLEAGTDQTSNPKIQIPGNWFSNIGSELDWQYSIVDQAGLYGRAPSQPAGRVLGGSSAINGLAFIAPSKATVDAWSDLGNKGWKWEDLVPYYRKFHTLQLPDNAVRKHLELDHLKGAAGISGPLNVSYTTPLSEPLAPAWSQSFKTLGFSCLGDPSSGVATGGFNSPASIDATTKQRTYSASAYWKPNLSRPNLELLTQTVVERVNFAVDGSDVVASGVEVLVNGVKKTIHARREVILSAGVFGSPKLLELSGIGDPKLLSQHQIQTLVANSEVGENFQDHLMTGISYEVNDNVETLDGLRSKDPTAIQAAVEAYEIRKEGPMSWGGINCFSYMPIVEPSQAVDSNTAPASPPFASILATNAEALETHGKKGLEKQYEFIKSVLQSSTEGCGGVYLSPRGTTYGMSSKASDYSVSNLPGKYVTIGLSLLLPFSRGNTHIASADPAAKPRIDPAYLSNPLDVEIAASHLAFVERLARTSPLADFLKPGGRRNSPLARGDDRDKAREWTRRSVLSNWHGCGTCAMMARDLGGVVDEGLRVYGTKRLRVVDASVMPIIPRGNTQSSVYMVAERAADIIKEDHGLLEVV